MNSLVMKAIPFEIKEPQNFYPLKDLDPLVLQDKVIKCYTELANCIAVDGYYPFAVRRGKAINQPNAMQLVIIGQVEEKQMTKNKRRELIELGWRLDIPLELFQYIPSHLS